MVELTVGVSHLVFLQTESQISCNNMNCECIYCSMFFMPGLFTKIGPFGKEEMILWSFLLIHECICTMWALSWTGWSSIPSRTGSAPLGTTLPTADEVFLFWGRALLFTHQGAQILSQLLLSSELGVPRGKLQVLMAHCSYWKVLSKLWPEAGGVRTASLPSLSEVSATHSPACVAMETLPWWPANSDHFSENNLMQSTETWGLQLPHTHRYTHSCDCLLCVMISASEHTNLLVRQEHVSQRGWLQTWLSPAQINKTSSCCLEQCIVTTTRQLVK